MDEWGGIDGEGQREGWMDGSGGLDLFGWIWMDGWMDGRNGMDGWGWMDRDGWIDG